MRQIVVLVMAMIGSVGCAYTPLDPSNSVDGDSYVFCPSDNEEDAKRALLLGQTLSMTEAEFIQHLSESHRTYNRLESIEMECGDTPTSTVQSVYRVNGINSRRIRSSAVWTVYYVSINEDGMVYQIEDRGEFVVVS